MTGWPSRPGGDAPRHVAVRLARVASGHAQARWAQAIGGEMFGWLLGLAVLVFAVTLNGKLSGIVFALSVVVYFAVVPLIKKRASAAGY